MTTEGIKIRNVENGETFVDSLHKRSVESTDCGDQCCKGSIMNAKYLSEYKRNYSKSEVLTQAKSFISEFYREQKLENCKAHNNRWGEIRVSIERMGTYDLTKDELLFGAKTAWRNAPRCVGRKYWNRLELFDARHVTTAKEMFEVLCRQLDFATNGGNIRTAIAIFPQRIRNRGDFRIWNSQLISYAGHRMEDGSIVGDPGNVAFTEICEKLGHKFKKTQFEILPLVLEAGGEDPEVFTIPSELIHEVPIRHPKYDIFENLDLRWYAVPAVSNMLFDCGGIQFTGAPFNGWYMTTEVAVRDLCDASRLNLLPRLARGMGMDTNEPSALWKDRALAEIHYALILSFKNCKTTIVDHYTATELFMEHFQKEYAERGGCPADWVWLVPPMSGSQCPVFHQEMLAYKLKPSYEYQQPAWINHVWKCNINPLKSYSNKISLRSLFKAVLICIKLGKEFIASRKKCKIIVATETGTATKFAEMLSGILKHNFETQIVGADDYLPVNQLTKEPMVLIIASTFGNGEPPGNAEIFFEKLKEFRDLAKSGRLIRRSHSLTNYGEKGMNTTAPLKMLKYGVFALGSTLYAHFCEFGHNLDDILHNLGAERLVKCGEGDEMRGQEQSFRLWVSDIFKAMMREFYPYKTVSAMLLRDIMRDETWTPENSRLVTSAAEDPDIEEAVSHISHEPVFGARVKFIKQLQSFTSSRKTLQVSCSRILDQGILLFEPGDHMAIFPSHHPTDVEILRQWMQLSNEEANKVVTLEKKVDSVWQISKRLPPCSIRLAFTYLIDLRSPPLQSFLGSLSQFATDAQEEAELKMLSESVERFETWKSRYAPDIPFLATSFPSARPTPAFLMERLPLIKPRYYSISSSPNFFQQDIQITASVVQFTSQDGVEHSGFCTSWLQSRRVDSLVPCYIRKAPNFRLPSNLRTPVVMVGAGSGLAPFRGFWQERAFQKMGRRSSLLDIEASQNQEAYDYTGNSPRGEESTCTDAPSLVDKTFDSFTKYGPFVLYFGCRSKSVDQIYHQEIERCVSRGIITDYHVALSREKGQPKTYVQDLMWLHRKDLYQQLVVEKGHLYVCGGVKMADDVANMLRKITKTLHRGWIQTDGADDYISEMKKDRRYHEDLFGEISVSDKKEAKNRGRIRRKSAPAGSLSMDVQSLLKANY